MKLISWNYKGLGSPRVFRTLQRIIQLQNPNLMLLMETRLKQDEIWSIQYKHGYDFCRSVECNGNGMDRARFFSLLWKENLNLSIMFHSLNHICGFVVGEFDDQPLFFIGINGFLDEQYKSRMWLLVQEFM